MENLTQVEAFELLIDIIHKVGWTMALPDIPDDEQVPGMIIGTEEFVNDACAGREADYWRPEDHPGNYETH